MFFLNYNPNEFDNDLRYLKGTHTDLLYADLSVKFKNNISKMGVKNVGLTETYTTNQSNIYSKKVKYDVELDYLEQRKNELAMLEKYGNCNLQALFWTYIKDGKLKSRALHASEFYFETDEYGNLKKVIVKSGSFFDSMGIKQNQFIAYDNETKMIYKKIATDWQFLTVVTEDNIRTNELKIDSWGLYDIDNPEESTFEVLPFTLFSKKYVIKPELSPITLLENDFSAGFAYGDYTAKIAFLMKIMLKSNMNDGKFKDFADSFGFNSQIAKIDKDDDVHFLVPNTITNQIDYITLATNILVFRAACDGVDKNAILNDTKVESGYSRRLQMQNIESVRESNIIYWIDFERRNWEVISELGFEVPSEVIYEQFNLLDKVEEADYKQKTFDLYEKMYQTGAISKSEFIALVRKFSDVDKVTPEMLTEADNIILKLQKERMNDVENIVDNSDVNIDTNDNNDNVNNEVVSE